MLKYLILTVKCLNVKISYFNCVKGLAGALLTCSESSWVVPSRYTKVNTSTLAFLASSGISIFSSGLSFPKSFTLGSNIRVVGRKLAVRWT